MATRVEVEAFLEQFRLCNSFGSAIRFRATPKNIRDLAKLNMTQAQAADAILRLTFENYSKGPEEDYDDEGKAIWVFGYFEGEKEVYIKLRLDPNHPFSKPLVRSFHLAEHPLAYPLKGGGK